MHPDTYGLIILEVAAIKIHLSISYFHGSSHLHAPAPPTSATSIIGVGLGHVAFGLGLHCWAPFHPSCMHHYGWIPYNTIDVQQVHSDMLSSLIKYQRIQTSNIR